jgi:hypothetical protein
LVAQRNAKNSELTTAVATRVSRISTLRNALRNGLDIPSTISGRVDILLARTVEYDNALTAYNEAVAQRDMYADEISNLDQQIADMQAEIATKNTEIAAKNTEIVAKQAQIDAETNPAQLARLQRELASLVSQRDQLVAVRDALQLRITGPTTPPADPSLTEQRATAVANRDAAQLVVNARLVALNTARGNYQAAYNNLHNAGRYALYGDSGNPPVYGVVGYACVGTGCQTGDVNLTTVVRNALVSLLGPTDGTRPISEPTPRNAYLLPDILNKEIAALNGSISAADEHIADIQAQIAAHSTPGPTPPCEISGSAVVPMTPEQAEAILIDVDTKGGTR